MILYMTSTPGGINGATGRPELLSNKNHFVDRLKGDWKPHSRCVLIASEPDDTKFNSAMAKTYLECFNRSGLSMDSIDVLDRREPKTVEILDRFDVVILAGMCRRRMPGFTRSSFASTCSTSGASSSASVPAR